MIKNIRLQVLMGLDQYNQLHNYCTEHKIKYKNDSDMFRKLLFKFVNEGDALQTQTYIMKQQIGEQKTYIGQLENQVRRLNLEIDDLTKDVKKPKK